jgi:hypothetical protein
MKYESVRSIPRSEVERLLSGSTEEVAAALLSISYYEPDRRWVFDRLEAAAAHPDREIRGLVATCIGHVGRIDREIDIDCARRLLDRLAGDAEVARKVEDAWDDVETYTANRRR